LDEEESIEIYEEINLKESEDYIFLEGKDQVRNSRYFLVGNADDPS
jgi:hypothetical protein